MIIKKIYIDNFGKFNNYEIDFDKGLNLVYGANESGKTTLMTFIMMAFYGSSQRKKDILSNPRKKYRPWNDKPMKGHIIFEYKNREYRLDRTFYETNNKDELSLIDNISGEKIEIKDPKEPGKYFFGMSYDSFKKSLFIDSEDLFFAGDDNSEIKEKLLNMISTSDENISYDKTRGILEEKLYSYKSRSEKKGLIPDLEEEIREEKKNLSLAVQEEDEKKNTLERLHRLEAEIEIENLKSKINKTQADLDMALDYQAINEKRKDLEGQIKAHEEDKRKVYSDLDQKKLDYHKLSDKRKALLEEKTALGDKLKNLDLDGATAVNSGEKNYHTWSKICMVAALLMVLAFAINPINSSKPYLRYGFLGLGIIFILVKFFYLDKKKEALEKSKISQLEREKIFKKLTYDRDLVDTEISSLDRKIIESKLSIKEEEGQLDLIDSLMASKREDLDHIKKYKFMASLDPLIIENASAKLQDLKRKYQEKEAEYLHDFASYLILEEVEDFESDRLLSLNREYERLKAYSKERYRNSRYPEEIRTNLRYLEERLEEFNKDYLSFKEALRILEKSYGDLSRDFGPLLNDKSQEIFYKLSGKKYEKLLISDDFDVKFEDGDQREVKDWKFLSSGARDQAYISLKLALAKLLSRPDNKILLLDDIFVKFDDKRAREGIDFFLDLEGDFDQIILFTCHKRLFDFVKDPIRSIRKIQL